MPALSGSAKQANKVVSATPSEIGWPELLPLSFEDKGVGEWLSPHSEQKMPTQGVPQFAHTRPICVCRFIACRPISLSLLGVGLF